MKLVLPESNRTQRAFLIFGAWLVKLADLARGGFRVIRKHRRLGALNKPAIEFRPRGFVIGADAAQFRRRAVVHM